jgi:hypothetical protein
MEERKINVELFKKIIAHAKKDLRRLEMQVWGARKGSNYAKELKEEDGIFTGRGKQSQWPVCNTKACCAGWAVLLSTPKSKWKSWFLSNGKMKDDAIRKATELLGLDEYQADSIFRGNGAYYNKPARQLEALRVDINTVFEAAGLKDRV